MSKKVSNFSGHMCNLGVFNDTLTTSTTKPITARLQIWPLTWSMTIGYLFKPKVSFFKPLEKILVLYALIFSARFLAKGFKCFLFYPTTSKTAQCYCLSRYETYLIPGETLIPGGRGEAFHPGIGYTTLSMFVR